MTTRHLIPNPPISTAIQRISTNDTEILSFIEDHGVTNPQFYPAEPDMIVNGDEPIWFNLVVHVNDWVIFTPGGNGIPALQSMNTTELEKRYNDLYTD